MLAAACGSGTPGEEAGDNNNADGDNEAEDNSGDTDDGGDVANITFWQQDFQDQENDWYEALVDDFNAAHDDIQVKIEVVPADAWEERLTAAQAAGSAPDVRTMNYGGIRDAASASEIAPVTSLISADAWADVKENVLPLVTIDGEQYGYPLLVEPSAVLYYRTDLFEEAGLDPNSPPQTWDELVDYAEQLTNDEVFGLRLAQNAIDASWSTWGYQYNVGGLPISDDWSTPQADDRHKPLLQAFKDLADSGALPPPDGIGYPDATPFGDGKFAMMANGSWAASLLINDYPDLVENIAVAPMPSFDGQSGQTTSTLGGWTLVVDGKSDDAQAAATFIEWAIGGEPENVSSFFEITKFSKTPTRTSVDEAVNALPDADTVNPWQATIAADVVPYAQGEPTYPWDVSLAMGEAIEAVMFGGVSVDDALADANDKIQAAIDNHGIAGAGS
jgi:multiple sugar transport system substrate-binding protein